MRIAFLCSSLENGRDGVGDYVRLLASACESEGHSCRLVALNDRHLNGVDSAPEEGLDRLPPGIPMQLRAERLRRILREFEPDWVSWQLVPYGYDPKGILPREMALLVQAASGPRQHVMLHELWLGVDSGDTIANRLVGLLQRSRLVGFLEKVMPSRIHTSNAAFRGVLASCGWDAGILPLFGNISVVPATRSEAEHELRTLTDRGDGACRSWVGVLFGTLHPQWDVGSTLDWLLEISTFLRRKIELVSVGRSGAQANGILGRLGAEERIRFVAAGELPAERISRLLQAADFGIATHPWALIEKSGTTAALLEHGLPVAVPRDDWRPRIGRPLPGPVDPLLARTRDITPGRFPAWLRQRREPSGRLRDVCSQLCAELGAHSIHA